ncbi:MAG: hypothetical protein HQM15_06840 [Deltaproteobacteria bacterium]|nr:hypothetical protein [Deltaproteobacteria bacterium]
MDRERVYLEISPEKFLADLTQVAYDIALKSGFVRPFIEVELELWEAFAEVIQKSVRVGESFEDNESELYQTGEQFETWALGA